MFEFNTREETPTQEKKITKSTECDLNGVGVYIAIPCHDFKLHLNTVMGLLELREGFMRFGVKGHFQTLGGSALIDKARADLVAHFLRESDADYLFFLDSDIGFKAHDVLRLITWLETNDDIDMVSAAYPAKTEVDPDGRYFINTDFDEKGYPIIDDNGLLKVNAMGLGFCAIRRRVLQGMVDAYPKLWAHAEEPQSSKPVTVTNLFIPFVDKNHAYWGEDMAFFIRAAAAGFDELRLDLNVDLQHVGRKVYTGNVNKALTSSVIELMRTRTQRDNPYLDAVEEMKNDETKEDYSSSAGC